MRSILIVLVLAAVAIAAPTPLCTEAITNVSLQMSFCTPLNTILADNLTETELTNVISAVCSAAGAPFSQDGACSEPKLMTAIEKATMVCDKVELLPLFNGAYSSLAQLVFSVCGQVDNTRCYPKLRALSEAFDFDEDQIFASREALDQYCDDCTFQMWEDSLVFPSPITMTYGNIVLGACLREGHHTGDAYCSLEFQKASTLLQAQNYTGLYQIGCETPCYHRMLSFYNHIADISYFGQMPYLSCNRNVTTPGGKLCWEVGVIALRETSLLELCLEGTTPSPQCPGAVTEFVAKTGCCGRLILPLVKMIAPSMAGNMELAFALAGVTEECTSDPVADRQFVEHLTIMNLDDALIDNTNFSSYFLLDLMVLSGLRNTSIDIQLESRKRHEATFTVTFTADSIPHKDMVQQQFEENMYDGRLVLAFTNNELLIRDQLYTPLTLYVPTAPAASSSKHDALHGSDSDSIDAATALAVGFSAIVVALAAAF